MFLQNSLRTLHLPVQNPTDKGRKTIRKRVAEIVVRKMIESVKKLLKNAERFYATRVTQ